MSSFLAIVKKSFMVDFIKAFSRIVIRELELVLITKIIISRDNFFTILLIFSLFRPNYTRYIVVILSR